MGQVWSNSLKVFLIHNINEGKSEFLDKSLLTFDLWRWVDLAQNLISSLELSGVPLCQVWSKSVKDILSYRVKDVKIEFIDLWPFTLGGSGPKSNQFLGTWGTTGPSLIKIRPRILELSRKRKKHFYIEFIDLSPLTLGGSGPKSNQFVGTSWGITGPSLIKIRPGILELSRKRRIRTDGQPENKFHVLYTGSQLFVKT